MEDPPLPEPTVKQPLVGDPQQNHFAFDNVIFSSQFDSGNLQNVIKIDDSCVHPFLVFVWFRSGRQHFQRSTKFISWGITCLENHQERTIFGTTSALQGLLRATTSPFCSKISVTKEGCFRSVLSQCSENPPPKHGNGFRGNLTSMYRSFVFSSGFGFATHLCGNRSEKMSHLRCVSNTCLNAPQRRPRILR